MTRIMAFLLCIAGAVSVGAPVRAQTQAYPVKPIRTVVPILGGIDTIARVVAKGLGQSLGQPVVVDTVSGAGGSIAQEAVSRAAPDGYTLIMSIASTHVIHGFLSKNSPFDPVKGYTPIAKVAESILLVTANSELPLNSMTELIEYAKRNPGKLSYGTTGIGSVHHFSVAEINALYGIDWVHVPYKTGPAVLVDTQAGRIQVGFAVLSTLVPFMNSGKLKILGINSTKRYAGLPNIPTFSEQMPSYEPPPTWVAYFGPPGLPQPIVARLNAEIVRIVNLPESRKVIEGFGSVVSTSTPEELGDVVKRSIASVGRVVKLTGIKPE